MKIRHQTHTRSQRGLTLIECLAYIGALGVLIAIGGYTTAKAWDQSRSLHHNTADIQRTLSIGERWRADIRAATDRITAELADTNQTVLIPTRAGEVAYEFRDGQLRRRASRTAAWVTLFETVRTSQMERFTRDNVTAWRWEIELQSTCKKIRVRPQFTFVAVPGREVAP